MPSVIAEWWAYAVLAAVLVTAAVWDVRTGRIPNALTYSAVAAGLIGATLSGGLVGGDDRLGLAGSAGLAAGFLPMLLAWLAGGIGGGDVKLMAAVGALTGWRFTLMAMFYGFAFGAAMAVIVLLRKRMLRGAIRRIWLFLLSAAARGGRPPDPAAADSPKVPFGLALCLGAAAAMTEAVIRGPAAVKLLGF